MSLVILEIFVPGFVLACLGVGWHADDEVIFLGTARDCPILSLVSHRLPLTPRGDGPPLEQTLQVFALEMSKLD